MQSRLEQQLQQRQQQHISPQQIALGRVLEMTAPEFEDEVRRELSENPALEAVEQPGQAPEEHFGESAEQLQRADYASDEDVPVYLRHISNRSADDPAYNPASFTADDSESMIEVLETRLRDDFDLTPMQMLAATYIIGNLDGNGYLTRPLPAIAGDVAIAEGLAPSAADFETAYAAIRTLDPAGIGAHNLRDCLMLQLERKDKTVETLTAREIVANHFEDFSRRHFDRLEADLGIPRERLAAALEVIRGLNPKPGSVFGGAIADRMRHISPDFMLEYDEDADRFKLTVCDNIPELAIEESFRSDPPAGSRPAAARQAAEYVRTHREAADRFIALARQRAATLRLIAKAIVHRQKRYFITGDRADLRPMVLRDISEDTGVSASTVSRAISGKYMQTPHGVTAMKSLFNESAGGDSDTAGPAILQALADIVEKEDKHNPLTDQQLVEALRSLGYDLARRTVAKYRERLGMPTARLRRQL